MTELTTGPCILPAGTGLIEDKSNRQGGNCRENVTQPVSLAAPPAVIASSKQQENYPKVFQLLTVSLKKKKHRLSTVCQPRRNSANYTSAASCKPFLSKMTSTRIHRGKSTAICMTFHHWAERRMTILNLTDSPQLVSGIIQSLYHIRNFVFQCRFLMFQRDNVMKT